MAATRNATKPSIAHIKFFASLRNYRYFKFETLSQRFRALESLAPPELARQEKRFYQDIHAAALYLLFHTQHYANVDLRNILPTRGLPTAVAYHLERAALVGSLEAMIDFQLVYDEVRSYALDEPFLSLSKYVYLYKEMHAVYQYTDILLRDNDNAARNSNLEKCVSAAEHTAREQLSLAQRIRQYSRQHREMPAKRLLAKIGKQVRNRLAPVTNRFEFPPNVIEWINGDYFKAPNGSDNVSDMSETMRAELRFTFMFLQRLVDEVSKNFFSRHNPKLAESFAHYNIVHGSLVSSIENSESVSIEFIITSAEDQEQSINLNRFLKLDKVAVALNKIYRLQDTTKTFNQISCVFRNICELLAYAGDDLEKFATHTEDGRSLFVEVPAPVTNSQRDLEEILKNINDSDDDHVEEKIFENMWALHTPALAAAAHKPKKPRKPRADEQQPAEEKRQEMKRGERFEFQKEKSGPKPDTAPSPAIVVALTPLAVATASVKLKQEKWAANVTATRAECKSLQIEFRKLFHAHARDLPPEPLADWAQRIEALDTALDALTDKVRAEPAADDLTGMQNSALDFNADLEKLKAGVTQIKNMRREISSKTGTLLIQQKLAAKKARPNSNGKTPPLTASNSPFRSPLHSPAGRAQNGRSAMSALSLFEAPRAAEEPVVATDRQDLLLR